MSNRDVPFDLRSSERVRETYSHCGYIPIREAARWAGVSPKTIRNWIRGGLPHYRGSAGGKVLVRPADIDQFLIKDKAPQIDLDRIVEEMMSNIKLK